MSSKKYRNAHLSDCGEAKFPDSLRLGHLALFGPNGFHATFEWIESFFRNRMHQGSATPGPVTSDGYRWLARGDFVVDDIGFSVLIPQATDATRDDGTSSDRHISIQAKLGQGVEIDGWKFSHAGRLFSTMVDVEVSEDRKHHRKKRKKEQ